MPNLESLLEKVAEIIHEKQGKEVLFTSLDMLYAYGQTILHPGTAKFCKLQIMRGEMTVTYTFKTLLRY